MVTATGGRDGRSVVEGGALDVKLSTPKELGGAGAAGNNPEQLFAAGYSACFLGAMQVVASHGGAKVTDDKTVKDKVGIGPRSEGDRKSVVTGTSVESGVDYVGRRTTTKK